MDKHLEDSSTRSWNNVANDWVQHADTNDYRNNFLFPNTFKYLGDVHGLHVLDLGCGEGGYARELCRRGADVVGVDGSKRMIEVAEKRAREENLTGRYIVANANALQDLIDEKFDVVLSSMTLMDVEDYEGSINEITRVLKLNGRLLMSITHPCFSSRASKWARGASNELAFFQVDKYFERESWESQFTTKFHYPVIRHHRPLEDFMRPFLAKGLTLSGFWEPVPDKTQIEQSPRLARLLRIPYFLFMAWEKSSHTHI